MCGGTGDSSGLEACMPWSPVSQVASPDFHPEFGYLSPSPPMRRLVRVALIAAACGIVLGSALSLHWQQATDATTARAAPGGARGDEIARVAPRWRTVPVQPAAPVQAAAPAPPDANDVGPTAAP